MFEEIMAFAGASAISYAIANALHALLFYREGRGKNSILDKSIEYAMYPFFLFGLPALLAIGSSHNYIQKLTVNNILGKHDRDIRKMKDFAWKAFLGAQQMYEEPYSRFDFSAHEEEVIDSLEIKPWN